MYYENNVASATVFLLQVISELNTTRLVYSSSATVYGTPPVIPIPENTRLEAHSPYGKTKVMCETIVSDFAAGESPFLDCGYERSNRRMLSHVRS